MNTNTTFSANSSTKAIGSTKAILILLLFLSFLWLSFTFSPHLAPPPPQRIDVVCRCEHNLNDEHKKQQTMDNDDVNDISKSLLPKSMEATSVATVAAASDAARRALDEAFPDARERKQFYDMYADYHRRRGNETCAGCALLPLLSRLYSSPPHGLANLRLLDAGAGNCRLLKQLRNDYNVSNAYGVELFDVPLVLYCAQEVVNGFAFHSALNYMPQFPNGYFDVVFSSDVLEHVQKAMIPSVLRELARVTRRNGHLLLAIALYTDSEDKDEQQYKFHATVESKQWWLQEFQRAGLSVDGDETMQLVDEEVAKLAARYETRWIASHYKNNRVLIISLTKD